VASPQRRQSLLCDRNHAIVRPSACIRHA
jgi:hypothetical protein